MGAKRFVLALLFALTGCQGTDFLSRITSGEPIVADEVWLRVSGKVQTTDIEQPNYIPFSCVQSGTASPMTFVGTDRAQIATCAVDMKTLIDRRFAKWMDALAGATSGGTTAVDVTVIGLGLAGTLTGGATTRILSAISSGLTGTKSTVEQDIFLTQSLQTIVTQMHTDRDKWGTIVNGRVAATREERTDGTGAVTHYMPYESLADAMNDLQTYARQGSFRNALYNLQTTAAAQSAACQAATLNQKAGVGPAPPPPPPPRRGRAAVSPPPAPAAVPTPAAATATAKCPDPTPPTPPAA